MTIIYDFTYIAIQLLLLLLLFSKEKNDGEKELFRQQHWKTNDVVLTVISVNTLSVIFVVNSYYRLFNFNNNYTVYLFVVILITLFFKFKVKQSVMSLGLASSKVRQHVRLIFAISIIKYVTTSTLSIFIHNGALYNPNTIHELSKLIHHRDIILYFILVIILGPVVEEIIYRGILYSPFRKKYGINKAIVITSLYFALSHVGMGVLIFFIGGLFLGYLYEKTESLLSTILAHSIYNILSYATVYLYMLSR